MNEDDNDAEQLWIDYKKNKCIALRNKLIVHYSDLVKRVVYRLNVSYKTYIDIDDLISFGNFGLIDAIEKFDPLKGVKFQTYASIRIKGAIIDHVRQQDCMPRNLRKKAKTIEQAIEYLENKYGRAISEHELAEYLSISVDELRSTMEQIHSFMIVSLDEQISSTIDMISSMVSPINGPEEFLDTYNLKRVIAEAIDNLPDKEKKIISLYYFDDLTLKEIGMVLGISESRVSQLHSKAIMHLENKLVKYKNDLL